MKGPAIAGVVLLLSAWTVWASPPQNPKSKSASLWKKNDEAGAKALKAGRYAQAEKLLLSAIREAETFGADDPRLALSLDNLAWLYYRQGKYEQALGPARRSLEIREKKFGPNERPVAWSLSTL